MCIRDRTHTDSEVKKAKTGAARIMLIALRSAEENNKIAPNIIPVGFTLFKFEKV